MIIRQLLRSGIMLICLLLCQSCDSSQKGEDSSQEGKATPNKNDNGDGNNAHGVQEDTITAYIIFVDITRSLVNNSRDTARYQKVKKDVFEILTDSSLRKGDRCWIFGLHRHTATTKSILDFDISYGSYNNSKRARRYLRDKLRYFVAQYDVLCRDTTLNGATCISSSVLKIDEVRKRMKRDINGNYRLRIFYLSDMLESQCSVMVDQPSLYRNVLDSAIIEVRLPATPSVPVEQYNVTMWERKFGRFGKPRMPVIIIYG